ncbi:MAG: hypothetical protein IT204_24630 [Fimbriimonadaceae bacterium]|nr:hypothetical protein [Fimbriimonadaceae bacterium]
MLGSNGWRSALLLLTATMVGGPAMAQTADQLYQQGEAAYAEFTWDKAIESFGALVAKHPQDPRVPEARFKVLHARARLERWDDFEADCTDFIDTYRRTLWGARGRQLLAEFLFQHRRWQNWERIGNLWAEALRDYRSAIGRRPMSAAEKRVYVEMLFSAAEFYSDWYLERSRDLAKEHLETILATKLDADTTARALLELGQLYADRYDDRAKAEASWLQIAKGYEQTSSADDALWRLGWLDYQKGDYVGARARFVLLRQKYPKSELEDDALGRIKEIEAPQVNLGISQTHLPGAGIPAWLQTRNLKSVTLTAYRVDVFGLFDQAAVADFSAETLLKRGQVVATWKQAIQDKGDYQWVKLKLQPPIKQAGFYLLEAQADGAKVRDLAPVNITSLVLVQQYAARKLVSYVGSRETRQPVAGAELRVLRPARRALRPIGKGTTNADGLWETQTPVRADEDSWQLLTVGRKGDEVVLQDDGLYAWWNEPTAALDAYVYTDRPVYRPENTVHYKAILRTGLEGRFQNLPSEKVEVVVRDARGEEAQKVALQTDSFGTVEGELTLGAEPSLGVWNIQINCQGQSENGSFRVEEYRKPEFKVEVGRPLADVRPGGAAAVPVEAAYYFGAPVADAEVKYVVKRRPYYHWYWFPGPWDWFYAGWRERPGRYWGDQVVREGTVKTDAAGKAVIEFATAEDANQDFTYTLDVEVADVTRRVVEATGSLTVTRKAFYLFANASQGLYAPDDDVAITAKAENADRQPVETPVTATLWKMKWVPEKVDPQTKKVTLAAHYERDSKVWPSEQRVVTDPASGEKALRFKAPGDGYYTVELSAADRFDPRASIVASAEFWVSSKAWKGVNYNHANLQLVTEKDLYQKGDTVRVLVNSPVPDAALLLTIGAEHIYRTQVYRLSGNTNVIEVPVADNYAPNVYLNAVVVAARQVYFADKELMVPPTDRFLKVKVSSDRAEYKPRTKGTFALETTDQHGRPVAAQVSLGITDDSVYAIQEELVAPIGVHFYGRKRWNGMRTAVSFEGQGAQDEEFAQSLDRKSVRRGEGGPAAGLAAPAPAAETAAARPAAPMKDGAPGGMGGGGGAGEEPIAIREFFPDTILWQPTVTTGADGKATVTVEVPDSLTTWRATARAITADTIVGQQVERVVSTKDLIVRLQAPRFFTQLDETTISLVVTNKTSQQQQVAVGLQIEGLELVGNPTDSVVLPPNGQARVDRVVKAVTPGRATITATARGADDSDGVKLTFPVLPHGAEKFAAAAGRVGAEGTAQATLNLPAARREDATKLTVTVSPTLLASLLDALPYLIEYPYGCVEQTTSKFLPAVMVARVLDYTGQPAAGGKPKQVPDWWQGRGLDELPEMVRTGIERLGGMQNPDGGYGWFGGMRSDPWMTAYVTQGLLQARLADFSVPNEMLEPAGAFLLSNLHLLRGRHDDTAYVLWVVGQLEKSGVVKPDAAQRKELEDGFQRVYANRDELNDYTRALLILALHQKGDADKAAVVWRNLQARRIETEHGVHWGQNRWGWRWSEDQVETTAMVLLATLAVEPNSTLADKAVQWLQMNRTGNRWYNTKDTATAIYALCSYADQKGELKSNYSLTLLVNGQEVKGWEVTPQNALRLDGRVTVDPKLLRSGDNTVELRRTGNGNVYYGALLEFYTKEDPITAASSFVSASRKYYRIREFTDENKVRQVKRELLLNNDQVASGDQIEVEVTVDAENEFDYVCLADPKPAGCEPVDQTSGGTWGGAYMYRELRDEEVTFFVDHLPQGKTTFSYRLRAESPGTFRALPHRGFSMYRDDVRCLSDEAILKIGERPAAVEG